MKNLLGIPEGIEFKDGRFQLVKDADDFEEKLLPTDVKDDAETDVSDEINKREYDDNDTEKLLPNL
jgi:hypothetical protein